MEQDGQNKEGNTGCAIAIGFFYWQILYAILQLQVNKKSQGMAHFSCLLFS